MKRKFRNIRLSKDNLAKLNTIDNIIEEYKAEGYVMTLRQLFYQLVSRDIVPNDQKEYQKLSKILKEGRMAGRVDWDAIEDRLRVPHKPPSWDNPQEALYAIADQYEVPRMEGQINYLEVWVEKDALSNVLGRVTEEYHVPILVNRGYSSASAMYDSFNRFKSALMKGKAVTILYLGDFDPSGLDMIRDIKDRILEFLLADDSMSDLVDAVEGYMDQNEDHLEFEYWDDPQCWEDDMFDLPNAAVKDLFSIKPIALTSEQIDQYDPPPNPAKSSDPRSGDFIKEHGKTSWEVDALNPETLNGILDQAIKDHIDYEKYLSMVGREADEKQRLRDLRDHL